MALNSTLYTGLTGMTVNQQKLNVIGNNIANVNTVAFKSSRALFKPQFYVTDGAGSPPSGTFGGTNPSQRGMGAMVSSIEKNFTSGTPESTGVASDLAIEGDGFFVVDSGSTKYTRDGSFHVNKDNDLVSSRGEYVMGYGVDKDFNVLPGNLQKINIPVDALTIAEATTSVNFKGNLNAGGELSTGASVLESPPLLDDAGATPAGTTPLVNLRNASDLVTPLFADGTTLTLDAKRGGGSLPTSTFTIDASTTVDQLSEFLAQGSQINTSAEVLASAPTGFTPGVSLASSTPSTDPAGSLRLTIVGNAGKVNALSLAGGFQSSDGTAPIAFTDSQASDATGEGLNTQITVYDSLGVPVNLNVSMALEANTNNGGTTWRYYATSPNDTNSGAFTPGASPADDGSIIGTGTVQFDEHGNFVRTVGDTVTIERSNTGASTPLPVKLDMSALHALHDTEQRVTPEAQDGFLTGTLKSYSIGQNGDIEGAFSNGLTRTLGRVAMAQFDNPEGLIDEGSNNFTVSGASGDAILATAGEGSAGTIRAGSLEQSNVDLSKEFIDMIVTTTGFSAASRVITTSNRMLDELLQTAR